MRERVVLFGGFGFVGRPLARALVARGHEVVVVDSGAVAPLSARPVPKGAHEVTCDVKDPQQIRRVLGVHKPDTVFWLAAKQGYDDTFSTFGRNNVAAVYAFFEAVATFKDVRPFIVLTSSQAVYQPGVDVPETWWKRPPSVYGFSKWQQEQAFQHFLTLDEFKSMKMGILRPCIILGPGQSMQSSESGVMRNWVRALQAGEQPKIYGDGNHVRDFVHVNDVVDVHLRLFDKKAVGAYNVNGQRLSINELAVEFRRLSNSKEPLVLGRDIRPGGEYSMTSQASMAVEVLGWRWKTPIVDQIGDFLDALEGVNCGIRSEGV